MTYQLDQDLNVYSKDGTILYTYKAGKVVSFLVKGESKNRYEVASEVPIKNNQANVKAAYNNASAYVKKSDLED